jgi:hypothetical protein
VRVMAHRQPRGAQTSNGQGQELKCELLRGAGCTDVGLVAGLGPVRVGIPPLQCGSLRRHRTGMVPAPFRSPACHRGDRVACEADTPSVDPRGLSLSVGLFPSSCPSSEPLELRVALPRRCPPSSMAVLAVRGLRSGQDRQRPVPGGKITIEIRGSSLAHPRFCLENPIFFGLQHPAMVA